MTELLTNPAILALIGTIFGGAGLKFIEHWLSKAKTRDDTATQIRNELRTELARIKEDLAKAQQSERDTKERASNRVDALEAEADGWRDKYYERTDEFMKVKGELANALSIIKQNAERATKQIKRLDDSITNGETNEDV